MVLAELAAYLEAQGLGTRTVNLFYGIMPPDPDALITMFEYGGLSSEPDTGAGGGTAIRIEHPRVQVVCRGIRDDYDGPRLKAQQVVAAFARIGNQTLSGIHYTIVAPLQPPFKLRMDDNHRYEFVCNYQVDKGFSAA
jgi:hypothetical protein